MSAFSTFSWLWKICIILYCASRPFVPETRHVLWNKQPLIWTILVRFFAGNNLNLDYWCCIQEIDDLLWSQIHCFLWCAICVFVSFQTYTNLLHRISHRSVQSVLSTRPGTLSISNTNLLADKLHMFRFPICLKWEMKNVFPVVLWPIFHLTDWTLKMVMLLIQWPLSSSFWNFQTSAIATIFFFISHWNVTFNLGQQSIWYQRYLFLNYR